jgi:hypothetical protein
MQLMRLFKPSLLKDPPRRPDGLKYLPSESAYQVEFYRVAASQDIALSAGFGKLGSKGSGAIDFFLPAKKWGFEFLANGKKILGHIRRFENTGQYRSWIDQGVMLGYVIIDCRTTVPKASYPGLSHQIR